MALILEDGDYAVEHGALREAEGSGALLQRVLWKLTVRRGSFPFLPELGSRLYLLPREKAAARPAAARQYVAEALAGEEDLEVTEVALSDREDGGLDLTVFLLWNGEALQGQVTVR